MTSQEYWSKREAEALKHRITDEKEYDKRIKQIYSDMLDACQSEIDAFYGKYAAKEGISLAEAKKRVSKLDIAAYERKAKRYVKEKNFSAKANEEMRLYNAAMKINRLEMLKANIGLELISGHDELDAFMSEILKGRTEDELKRQAGILGETVKNNAAKAHAIVNASFHNATFSDRIWFYQELMRVDLSKLLESGLIQGKNPRVLARELKKTFQTSTFNAERLMRTELARVQTEAQKQSFERNGFDEYTFIVNGGCCDICQGLSGKHFKVSKMMPGENAPPMHPHCRCSTAAYSDRAEYEQWLDFLEKGGTTEEYNRKKTKDENINGESVLGLKAPVRPKRVDSDSEDDYLIARNKYREERERYQAQIENAVKNNLAKPRQYTKEADVRRWAKKNDIEIDDVVFEKVDIRAFDDYIECTDDLLKKYPDVRKSYGGHYRVGVGVDGDELANALGGFQFGKKFENYADVLRTQFEFITNGYLVQGDGTVKGVYRHEFGHNLYFSIKQNLDSTAKRVEFKRDVLNSLSAAKDISEYALTNDEELFAEGFAAYESGEKGELAKRFGELLKRWYK